MVSGVAHEINNPLTAVMGYTELLLGEHSLSERSRTMLGKVMLCADRCQRIVQGLSSFARKADLQKKQVNINEIIDKAIGHRDYDLSINNIDIVKEYEGNLPMVTVDPNQIEQVFLNLINNACDSILDRNSPGKLKISTRLIEGSAMQIEFTDNGCGIRESDRAKVFEPFFTTKEVGKGTGLGLSVSYGIIKEHGGTLHLDHGYHDGAKFVITLPIVNEHSVAEPPNTQTVIPPPSRSRAAILVVDDEEVITEFVKLALSSRGFVVDCASDGKTAYDMLKSNPYDLVISDIRMPGAMDGKDLYHTLSNERPELAKRFVFISGDVNKRETADFLEKSGRAFLLKPFSIKTLEEVVEKNLPGIKF
jgi:CheY-like chemotaxis protein